MLATAAPNLFFVLVMPFLGMAAALGVSAVLYRVLARLMRI